MSKSVPSQPGSDGQQGGPILCVEDDPAQLAILTRYLSRAGYACLAAADGREALELANLHRPPLLIIDLEMPNLGGLGFLVRLRSRNAFKTVPVIVQTAHATRENLLRFAEVGVRSVLAKPYTEAQLLGRVRQFLPKNAAPSL